MASLLPTMNEALYVRMTSETKSVLALAAAKLGLSVPAFVRQAALEAAKRMGAELSPTDETIKAFANLNDDPSEHGEDPVVQMEAVISVALKPVERPRPSEMKPGVGRPVLRADIEASKTATPLDDSTREELDAAAAPFMPSASQEWMNTKQPRADDGYDDEPW